MVGKKIKVILDTNIWVNFLISKTFSKLDHFIVDGNIELLFSEDIAEKLGISVGTVQSKRWQRTSGCPVFRRGKRLYALSGKFLEWLETGSRG